MDIFPDGNLVRDIQKELDEIIQQGVFQITKLLQNSETAISSNQPDEDTFSISQRKGNVYRSEWRCPPVKVFFILNPQTDNKLTPLRGRLTERLLAQGLLTPNMLQELRKEWNQKGDSNRFSHSPNNDDDDDPSPFKKLRRKRTSKK